MRRLWMTINTETKRRRGKARTELAWRLVPREVTTVRPRWKPSGEADRVGYL